MFIYILFVIISLYLLAFKSKRSLHMLQQNLYNENNRYLKWVFKNYKIFLDAEVLIVAISIVSYFVLFDLNKVSIIALVFMMIISLIMGYVLKDRIRKDQNKKPLVYTPRVKRLIVTSTILYLIPVVLLIMSDNSKSYWLFTLIYSLMLYLNIFILWIANIINKPVEYIVYLYYKSSAVKKLKSMSNLKVVGITGSYGKTSSKNILADILNVKYNAFPTPRNLNTPKGLMTAINNNLDKFCDVFIAEMGAYKRGEIKELCDFVHPKYGILTKIGTAHLSTFGSQENIQKTKFELIESLPSDGIGVLNGDDPLQINYKLENKVNIKWIGIDNKDVDVRATNIKCSNNGTSFDVVFKGDKKKYKFETKLLGKHNVYNILSSIALGVEFGISINDLEKSVSKVRAVPHRLELKKLGNFYQIDDAYNSNPVGAKNACEVLSMMPGIKVVVTPGMIELGDREDEENMIFGREIARVADYVVLVGEKKTKPIMQGLMDEGFDKEKILVLNDIRDAYPFVQGLVKKEDVYALFENDLPDTYNE